MRIPSQEALRLGLLFDQFAYAANPALWGTRNRLPALSSDQQRPNPMTVTTTPPNNHLVLQETSMILVGSLPPVISLL